MNDRDLLELGFVAGNDGVLHAPDAGRVRLTPYGKYYELRISLGDGNAVVAVINKRSVKVTREGKP